MKKNTDHLQKNYIFQSVSSFCGLRISLYTAEILLAVSFLLLVFSEYRTASPLYILLSIAIAPGILTAILFPSDSEKSKKRENDLPFPLFCKKYHYNPDKYKVMNHTFLILFILLGAWHISCNSSSNIPSVLTVIPASIAAISILIRIISTIGYRIYFYYYPIKAMR